MLCFLLPSLLFPASAFPSFRLLVPNGFRVPCPPGAEGCRPGDTSRGEPESVCFGLGHEHCAGGHFARNSFGLALKEADFKWTPELCNADSDGDGFSNGEELGDPCCTWVKGTSGSSYLTNFVPSHPGLKTHTPPGYARPSCGGSGGSAAPAAVATASFAPGEEQRHIDFFIKNYTIPAARTTYENFAFNFDDDSHPLFHIAYGVAIVSQPKLLHHYVVTGCSEKVPDDMVGVPLGELGGRGKCQSELGGFAGWAPGATLWDNPVTVGVPVGREAGVRSFMIQVHFTDGHIYPNSVSQDGLRIYYTPNLRPSTARFNNVIFLARAPIMIPPHRYRYFLTRKCQVKLNCSSCELPVISAYFHAHVIGTEMYQTLERDGKQIDLGSQSVWHFDDQATFDLQSRNLTLRTGDVIQSTCVWDSSLRSAPTLISLETQDEMCVTTINTAHARAEKQVDFVCEGDYFWEGELQQGEDATQLAYTHPLEKAAPEKRWKSSLKGEVEGFDPSSKSIRAVTCVSLVLAAVAVLT